MNKRVVTNAAWIIGCRVVQSVLQLIVGMLTARYLGPSNYGLINYAASLVAFVAPVMKLGLDSILVQQIVQHPEREGETLGSSIVMNVFSSILCIVGLGAFVFIANAGEKETLLICLLYSTILIAQALEMMQYWFQAKLLSKYTSVSALVAYIAISGYRVWLLITGKSVYWFAVASVLDVAIIDICMLIMYKRLSSSRLRFSAKTAKELFSRSKYYIISSLLVTVFVQTGSIMLKLLMDNSATGYYTAALSCLTMTSFVFSAIIDSARPTILQKRDISYEQFRRAVVMLYSIIFYVALAQCIFITLFSEGIIYLLYGGDYYESISVLRITVWYTPFSYLGAARNVWILANQKEKVLWKINLVGSSINIVLNLVLIPIFGIIGAAITAVATQFITNILTNLLFKELRENLHLILSSMNPKLGARMVSQLIPKKRRD